MTTSAPRPACGRAPSARGRGARDLRDVEDVLGAEAARRVEPRPRRPDDEDPQRARELREDRGVQPDGSAALDDDRVAERDAGALDRVEAGGQPAAAAQEVLFVESLGERHEAHARKDLDPLGPAAEQARRSAAP